MNESNVIRIYKDCNYMLISFLDETLLEFSNLTIQLFFQFS